MIPPGVHDIYMEKLVIKKTMVDLLFRFGFSSIFLANSLTAWLAPNEFTELLKSNSLVSMIAGSGFWISVIGVNDGLLFLLILSGRWRKAVAVWAALWMIAVIYVTGFGVTELIEHTGFLSLIAYYYFVFKHSSSER